MIQLRAIFLPLFQRDAKLFELYCTKWRVKCKTRLLGCVRAGRSLTSARRSFAYKRALDPGIYCCLCNVYYYKALLLRARALKTFAAFRRSEDFLPCRKMWKDLKSQVTIWATFVLIKNCHCLILEFFVLVKWHDIWELFSTTKWWADHVRKFQFNFNICRFMLLSEISIIDHNI